MNPSKRRWIGALALLLALLPADLVLARYAADRGGLTALGTYGREALHSGAALASDAACSVRDAALDGVSGAVLAVAGQHPRVERLAGALARVGAAGATRATTRVESVVARIDCESRCGAAAEARAERIARRELEGRRRSIEASARARSIMARDVERRIELEWIRARARNRLEVRVIGCDTGAFEARRVDGPRPSETPAAAVLPTTAPALPHSRP